MPQPHRTRTLPGARRPVVRTRLTRVVAGFAVFALALVPACAGEPTDGTGGGLTPESFIEIMVALREAERGVLESDSARAEFERERSRILAEHDATEDDLREFVRAHEGDFSLMTQVWDSVAQRLKYVPEPREEAEPAYIQEPR